VLTAEAIDAEAGEWMLPAVAVRRVRGVAPLVRSPRGAVDVRDARVVVLGATWAAPLAGHVLARLGAHVVRVTDPRRADPFPLRDALFEGCEERSLDLGDARALPVFDDLLASSDLLIDGTTPRVLANVGLAEPPVGVVRIAAFAHDDRPGYGFAAECRGGWAARYDPPRLARVSVADPVAALLAVLAAVDGLMNGGPRARARVSLEDAVGHLFAVEAEHG
jgi:crotonobetainyl-CoA:carnitine CoA-transferase CaiB-like acyl-CoA transferase